MHNLTVDRANDAKIVERLVEPTCRMATRKSLSVESLGKVLQGKHGIVVTALRQAQATRGKGHRVRRK